MYKIILKYNSTKIVYTDTDLNSLYYYLLSTTLKSLDSPTNIHIVYNNQTYSFKNMKQVYKYIEGLL